MKQVINAWSPAPIYPDFQPAIVFQSLYLASAKKCRCRVLLVIGGTYLDRPGAGSFEAVFPSVAGRIELLISDERPGNVGQVVALPSLPVLHN